MMQQAGPDLLRLGDLRALVKRSPHAALIFGLPEQRVGVANEALAELIGSPQSAIVGMQPAALWHGADGRRCQVALAALASGALETFGAVRRLHTDRGPVPVSVRARRVEVIGGFLAVLVLVPETRPRPADRTLAKFLVPDAELDTGGWRNAQPLVDASRFAALDQLPRRQRVVVHRLLRGERVSSIAASMYLSASTVRNHLSHAFAAFGVHSQSELLALLLSDSRAGLDGDHEDRE